ncbi:unnamed protein product [Ixodes hexagonus]
MESESLDMFYARPRQLARHCAFADMDTEILDASPSDGTCPNQILLATMSSRLRRYAMQHDLDLGGIPKQGRVFEEVEYNVSVMERIPASQREHDDGASSEHQAFVPPPVKAPRESSITGS